MSNYIVRDIVFLWKWAWTHWPWCISRKPPNMTGISRRMYWRKVVQDGWFLGWPLWLGKRRGKG